jgi:hypothetical protein
MENQEWQEIVEALVDAKHCLASVWQILDGTDGAASGVEPALNAALASIDAIYAIEHVNAYNATSRPQSTCRSSGRSTASFPDSRPAPDPNKPRRALLVVDARSPSRSRLVGPRVPSGQRRCRSLREAANDCR